MTNFDHLKALNITGRTSWCYLPEIGLSARLHVRPANESNPEYYNALLKRAGRRVRAGGAIAKRIANEVEQDRLDTVALYPKHIVIGWEDIKNKAGTLIPFSATECQALFDQLSASAPWLLDRIRAHVSIPENFFADEEDLAPDAGELAKN